MYAYNLPFYYTVDIDDARDKLGYNISVSIINVTTHGFPATGKTSVINLVMARPPVINHHSTGVAEPPSCSIIVGDDSSEDVEWEELPPDRMLDVLCKTIEALADDDNLGEPDEATNETEATNSFSGGPSSSFPLSHTSSLPSAHTSLSSTPISLAFFSSRSSHRLPLPLPPLPDYKRDYPQILRDMIKRLPKVDKPTTLSESRLILMSDSGGQPNYLDIFPLFVHNKCLAIYTLKLNEQLESIPQFSYSIEGRPIRMANTLLQHSYWQLLESLAKSMSSFLPSLQGSSLQCNSRFTIVGTFADKMDECEETIGNKNTTITKNLKAYEQLRVNYKGKAIFPINAITSDRQKRREYRRELRRQINKESPCIKVDIKLLWFAFYLTLLSSAKAKQRAILSLQECLDIGRSLDMDEQETRKAITFFHNLNLIFHCQSEELDDSFVIIDLKPIFDLVSNLIGVSFIDEDELHDFFCIRLPSGVREHFQKHGCFSHDTLKNYFHDKFPELLNAKAFIHLLAEIKAVAIIDKSDAFFMPCVLRYASKEEEDKIIKHHSCPWIVRLRTSQNHTDDYVPLPPSFSPTLVVSLLSFKSFKIDKAGPHQYRNIFTLRFDYKGDVIIIERQLQLEIYYYYSNKECFSIRSDILEAILETKNRLSISDAVQIEESFPCSCTPHQIEQCQLRHVLHELPRHILCQPDTLGGLPCVGCNLRRMECDLNDQQLRWLVQGTPL